MIETATIGEYWPTDGLEHIKQCPVCGTAARTVLYRGLRDRIFFCAPGEWTLYRCNKCGSGYIDPRPTIETIGLAYRSYVTHTVKNRESYQKLSLMFRLRRILANGYRNYRFGLNEQPSSRLGVLAAMLLPMQLSAFSTEMRELPKPIPGGKLLDIGCGNGDFLYLAQRSGWEAVGVEPDPKAAEAARSRGLNVRQGGVGELDPKKERFDGITLNHVIEHIHDPVATLHSCYQLLKPGGWIWLETPNLDAQGHLRYAANWYALDPPRHLVIFTHISLQKALEKAGFRNVQVLPYRPSCAPIFAGSKAIAEGRDPNQATLLPSYGSRAVRIAERKARKEATIREFIIVKGWKK